jgi:hypothetical protein
MSKNNYKILRWIIFELKLIFRCSSSRKIVYSAIFVILLPIISKFLKSNLDSDYQIMINLFVISFFSLGYAQYYYSWHSSHISFLLIKPINYREFLLAKVILLSLFSFFNLLFCCCLYYMRLKILETFFCYFLYNSGFLSFVVLFMGLNNTKKIDLKAKEMFDNWNNASGLQIIIGVLFFAPPGIILVANKYCFLNLPINYILGMIGFVFLILSRFWLPFVSKKMQRKKYSLYNAYYQ